MDELEQVVRDVLRIPASRDIRMVALSELGLDSLTAVEVVSRLQADFGITIALSLLRSNSTLDSIAQGSAFGARKVASFPQHSSSYLVSWRTAYLVEYIGPLVIYPLFLFPMVREVAYPPSGARSSTTVQWIVLFCWILHFLKRELETVFLHKFSNDKMPLKSLIKNCLYYWTAGFAVGYTVNDSRHFCLSGYALYICLVGFLVAEGLNFLAHLHLANLRPGTSKAVRLPTGWMWDYVTCPNYSAEILSWIFFCLLARSFIAAMFTAVGSYQMLLWASKKHARLCAMFPGQFSPSRRLLIPYLL